MWRHKVSIHCFSLNTFCAFLRSDKGVEKHYFLIKHLQSKRKTCIVYIHVTFLSTLLPPADLEGPHNLQISISCFNGVFVQTDLFIYVSVSM